MGANQSDRKLGPTPTFPRRTSMTLGDYSPSTPTKNGRTRGKSVKFRPKTMKPGSLRSSRRYYNEAAIRKSLELKREDSKASLIPRLFRTPLRGRRDGRLPARSISMNEKDRGKYWKEMKLSKKLRNLTKEQLSDLILQVTTTNPQIEKEFHEICPQPDILHIKRNLFQLLDCIYKAFPKYHIGSMRDDFCYEMVASHIHAFKIECLNYCKEFHKDSLWHTLIEYILMAWPIVNRLPEWNNDEYNALKKSILQQMVARIRSAIKATKLKREELVLLKNRIEEAVKLDRSIESALDDVNKVLQTKD